MASEVRAICPECGSLTQSGKVNGKFYYNPDKGLGYCHHCGFKGKFNEELMENLNVIDIKAKINLNPSVYESLEPLNEVALRYLAKRFPGVQQSQLEASHLRYSKNLHAIAIPTFKDRESRELQGIKYRFLDSSNPLRYTSEPGSQNIGYWLNGSLDKLLVVEGEFDALTAYFCSFKGTILALQTNRLSPETIQRLNQFKNVFVCLDKDEAGNEGLQSVKACRQDAIEISVPKGKDLNEYLQLEGLDESIRFIQEATRSEIEKATVGLLESVPEMLEFLSDDRNTRGTSTGYRSLDSLLGGGLRPAEMTVINAFAKTGKTSFINNLVHNLACIGKKIGICSFEMDPARMIYPSLLSIAGQTNIRQISDGKVLKESVELLQKDCAYLNNIITLKRFGYTPWQEIEDWAALMKERFGIEYLVLDHAGFMVEKMTDAEDNQILAKNIKKLTNTLGIHILVVVQAPKTKDGLSIQTAYGGLAWSMNCDNFIILERDKQDDTLLKVRLEAARYPGAQISSTPVHLFYDRETCTLGE